MLVYPTVVSSLDLILQSIATTATPSIWLVQVECTAYFPRGAHLVLQFHKFSAVLSGYLSVQLLSRHMRSAMILAENRITL